jgi:hypothetical protein
MSTGLLILIETVAQLVLLTIEAAVLVVVGIPMEELTQEHIALQAGQTTTTLAHLTAVQAEAAEEVAE